MKSFLQLSAGKVFIGVFLLCFLVQGWIWNYRWMVDESLWVEATQEASVGILPVPGDFLYGYPASTILVPAGMLVATTGDAKQALRNFMVFALSLVSALTSVLAYRLRPASYWWLIVGWVLAFQPLFILSTPPAALTAALAGLLALLVLTAAQEARVSARLLAGIGMLGGVMLATRLDFSLLLLGTVTVFLSTRRLASLYIIPLFALLGYIVLDPTVWQLGLIEHVGGILHTILNLADTSWYAAINPYTAAYAAGRFGLVALLLGVLLALTNRLVSLPRDFVVWLSGGTVLGIIALVCASHHPFWLFFILLLQWELLLPLLFIDGLKSLPENGTLRKAFPLASVLRVSALTYLLYQVGYFFLEISWFYF